jgi:hypothetical protein
MTPGCLRFDSLCSLSVFGASFDFAPLALRSG